MKRMILFLGVFCPLIVFSQDYTFYKKTAAMIPMRDGIKLNTSIYIPANATGKLPIILNRTPYGIPSRDSIDFTRIKYYSAMAKEGYIFVFQDIRGKFNSE